MCQNVNVLLRSVGESGMYLIQYILTTLCAVPGSDRQFAQRQLALQPKKITASVALLAHCHAVVHTTQSGQEGSQS